MATIYCKFAMINQTKVKVEETERAHVPDLI